MCTVTSLLDLPWKTTPKWLLDCQNLSTGSKVIEMSLSMSADVYSYLTIGLALKIYTKMTLKLPKLKICTLDQKLWRCIFSWQLLMCTWTHHWIGFEKLSQNDTWHFEIHPLDQKLWRCLFPCQLQWPHCWIGLEKLTQKDFQIAKIPPLDGKLQNYLFLCQLMCTVTSPLDWAWQTTPIWPLLCLNTSIGSKVKKKLIESCSVSCSNFEQCDLAGRVCL